MTIRVLPRQLVNKIAAGEVIERPGSVVKELIENAIDAGATRLDVEVADGGKKLISVRDDGAGMSAEDLALAFASHATSKLASEEDLLAISTMGFRGEALASVASVSHAHIRTRRKDAEGGYELSASGETIEPVRPCAAAAGTTVTVRDLFFNTPARRKFLRTANTEMGHVSEHVARLALPHAKVAFTLRHNGREIHNLPPAESTHQRLGDLFGGELADALLPLTRRSDRVGIDGLIGLPSAARTGSRWQYFFLNGRYIRDRLLGHALREAFRGLIEPNRSAVAFIFLEIDPAEVDVNVHPTKIEVRFHEPQLVHGALLAALKETLNKANLTPDASLAAAAEAMGQAEPKEADQATEQRRQSLRQALADFFKAAPRPQRRFSFPEPQHAKAAVKPSHTERSSALLGRAQTQQQIARPGSSATELAPESQPRPAPAPPPPPAARQEAIQIHNSYIIAADAEGLIIIDQHALHERLIYNDLKRRLADPDKSGLAGQRLLIPETLEVTAAEAATLEGNAERLAKLGIEVACFGPTAVAIQQFPSLLAERGAPAGEFLREVLDKLTEHESANPEELLEDLLEIMACKAAVKAGERLSGEEIDSLLARRQSADKVSACPHGRPTSLKLTLRELEKQFKRT